MTDELKGTGVFSGIELKREKPDAESAASKKPEKATAGSK